ncbi:MAG: FHA domain-containing protein, partial [Anaerolineae bacterium]|nr:FHA domain-containing protein [Anaerolineae bacterium]
IEDAQTLNEHGEALAPNHYWVTLSAQDLAPLEYFQPHLADDLAENVRQTILHMGLRMDMPPRILLRGLTEMPPHHLRVTARWIPAELPLSETSAGASSTLPRRPFLIVDGRRQVALVNSLVRIGRSRENDVILDDRRVSRHHLELRWQVALSKFLCVDLNSSGGTKLNGYAIKECPLEAGDVISLGGCEVIYGEEFALYSTAGMSPAATETSDP